MKSHSNGLHTIHQIDSIYQGQLNNSYQKDGFGIQQTFNFDTYIGYWKNNKIEGLGLVILANGTFIFANFIRNAIDGLTIIDDGNILICGIYRDFQMVGVGFQYNHQLKTWRMNRYHKGVSIQTIKQQICNIATGLPKIINVQQSLYFHLYKYVTKEFFQELELHIYTQISNGVFLYGFTNETGFNGPGIVVNNYQVCEAGFYEDGQLHGFGMKVSKDPFMKQFGCYHKGRKDGEFMEKQQKQVRYHLYRKGILTKNLPNSETLLVKNQKKYNFNCKDFFSAKNSIPFDTFKDVCANPAIRQYQQKKNPAQKRNLNYSPKKLDNYTGSISLNTLKKSPIKEKSPIGGKSYVISQQKQKTSVQIMKQKMGQYYKIVSGRKKKQQSPKKLSLSNIQINSFEQDAVANQQNPFF